MEELGRKPGQQTTAPPCVDEPEVPTPTPDGTDSWRKHLPPDLHNALPTALERSMTYLVNGPDARWMQDAHA